MCNVIIVLNVLPTYAIMKTTPTDFSNVKQGIYTAKVSMSKQRLDYVICEYKILSLW